MTDRTKREQETRIADERPKTWQPGSILPTPDPDEQYAYRWIRVSSMGQADNKNVSAKFRDGWVPVRAEDFPQFSGIVSDRNSDFKGNIEIGGLVLCRNDIANVKARQEYYGNLNRKQIESVDNNYLRDNNPVMPKFAENKSRTTFGTGN